MRFHLLWDKGQILTFPEGAYGEMAWITVHAEASVAKEADFSPVKHFAGQDSREDNVK